MTTETVKAGESGAARCPDHDVLHRLLVGEVDDAERRAVQAHLDHCESCHEQMVLLVQSTSIDLPEVEAEPLSNAPGIPVVPAEGGFPVRGPALAEGTEVGGDFVVEQRLASGGMGSVYAAHQRSTGRACALKVMHAPLALEPELQARFLQEAKVASRIESEHVVQVLAVGVDGPNDCPWLAMERLEGMDLRGYVRAHGALAPGRVESFVAQICDALSAAHGEGVVHRDLKPQNLFVVERDGAEPHIKLLDFGIAKVLVDGTYDTTGAMGSPAWMAPEQCSPGRSIRPATDVWSLGLLTFYMYTGRPFWRAMNERAGVGTLMREMLFEPLAMGSDRARALGTRFPQKLDRWLEACLERDPNDRPSHAGEAFERYRTVLDAKEVEPEALAPTVVERSTGMARIVLAALVMAGLGWGFAVVMRGCG